MRVGLEYVHAGIGWTSLAAALLAGAVITLMTWMELSSEDAVSRLFAALAAAFLLAIGPLSHAVVVSLELFAALHAGAPFGYFEWLKVLGWATLGNVIGGLALVTMLRLVQVGRDKIVQEQRRSRIDWRWRDRQGQSSRSAPVDEGWRTDAGYVTCPPRSRRAKEVGRGQARRRDQGGRRGNHRRSRGRGEGSC